MSRNLCSNVCYHCGAELTLVEPPHPITKEEAGAYFSEFQGMPVARAICPDCDAQYLAWLSALKSWHGIQGTNNVFNPVEDPPVIHDTSYYHSFNDEPAPEDLPRYRIVRDTRLYRVPVNSQEENTVTRMWSQKP